MFRYNRTFEIGNRVKLIKISFNYFHCFWDTRKVVFVISAVETTTKFLETILVGQKFENKENERKEFEDI